MSKKKLFRDEKTPIKDGHSFSILNFLYLDNNIWSNVYKCNLLFFSFLFSFILFSHLIFDIHVEARLNLDLYRKILIKYSLASKDNSIIKKTWIQNILLKLIKYLAFNPNFYWLVFSFQASSKGKRKTKVQQ